MLWWSIARFGCVVRWLWGVVGRCGCVVRRRWSVVAWGWRVEHCGLVWLMVPNGVHWVWPVRRWATAHMVEVVVVAWPLDTWSAPGWKIVLVVWEVELLLTNLSFQSAPHLLLLRYLSLWRVLLLGRPPLSPLFCLLFRALEGFLPLRGGFLLCGSHSLLDLREMLWGWSHIELLKENIGGGGCNCVRGSDRGR